MLLAEKGLTNITIFGAASLSVAVNACRVRPPFTSTSANPVYAHILIYLTGCTIVCIEMLKDEVLYTS